MSEVMEEVQMRALLSVTNSKTGTEILWTKIIWCLLRARQKRYLNREGNFLTKVKKNVACTKFKQLFLFFQSAC